MWRATVLTIFPEMFPGPLGVSLAGKALAAGIWSLETHDIRHVFVMTGAAPSTRWLDGCVVLDEHKFIKTGPELSAEELSAALWPVGRPPHLLETSKPGVFAVGDVRSGNIKRVASAVGEGSIAVSFVHQALRE